MPNDTPNLPAESKTAVPAIFDFAPRNMDEAMRLADMLASSSMVPKDYLGKSGNVLVSMAHGAELGLKPFQALQSVAVINGKPGIYGDAGKAILLREGYQIIEREPREVEAKEEAECTIVIPGSGQKVTRTFSKADAVRAKLWTKDGPWTTYPWRQMAWRAFWFAARDAAANVLKGMAPAEELRDMVDVTAGSEVVERTPPAAVSTATDALKSRLAPSPKAAELIAEFAKAATGPEVKATLSKVDALPDLSIPDKAKLKSAYRDAVSRVSKEADPAVATSTSTTGDPPVALTDEQIIVKLDAAENPETAGLIVDAHVNPLEAGDRKAGLLAYYRARIAKF